jgi:hypothetical protein
LKEEVNQVLGDQSHPTTSGTTTGELKLSVKILDMVRVSEPEPEIQTTENNMITQLVREDAQLETETSSNAESMVETTMI